MGDHGYPRLYQNFADEIIAPLADYGGGSGTGGLYLNEPGFPGPYGDSVFTTDWTTGKVHRHPMEPFEATFKVEQETFHDLPRAVDIDVDGSSRIYLADWRNGGFKFEEGKEVGLIHRVLPPGWEERPFPDLDKIDDAELSRLVGSDSAVMRLEAQREILDRGQKPVFASNLLAVAKDQAAHLYGRVAAIFTFKQLYGKSSTKSLVELTEDPVVREFALRALADRKSELEGVPLEPFLNGLKDPNPRVQLQALNGLARLNATSAAPQIYAASTTWNLDRKGLGEGENNIVPHVGIKALVSLKAVEASLAALEDPATQKVALRALQEMHLPEVVDGLISVANGATDDLPLLEGTLGALARLYHKEETWDLKDWWHTRPDDRGPYYKPVDWEATPRIRETLENSFLKLPEDQRPAFIAVLARNRIPVSKLKLAGLDPLVLALSVDRPDETELALFVDAATDKARPLEQRLEAYRSISKAEVARSSPARVKVLASWLEQPVHPDVEGHISDFVNETARGDELGSLREIGRKGTDSESRVAWRAIITVLNSPLSKDRHKEAVRKWVDQMPMEVGFFLAIADLKATGFEKQIEVGMNSDNELTIRAAEAALKAGGPVTQSGRKVGEMKPEEVTAHAMKNKGDVAAGERLYVSQGCIACHAVDRAAIQKGPYLGSAGAKFQRDYLIESIIAPDAVVAQGFQTVVFEMNDGSARSGFVTSEADDIIELRDIAGQVSKINRADVKKEQHLPQSMMPPGLGDSLSVEDFTSLIEYLVSLKAVGG